MEVDVAATGRRHHASVVPYYQYHQPVVSHHSWPRPPAQALPASHGFLVAAGPPSAPASAPASAPQEAMDLSMKSCRAKQAANHSQRGQPVRSHTVCWIYSRPHPAPPAPPQPYHPPSGHPVKAGGNGQGVITLKAFKSSIRCNHCSFQTYTEYCMIKHLVTYHCNTVLPPQRPHGGGFPLFGCPYCHFQSDYQDVMAHHLLEYHRTTDPCDSCTACLNRQTVGAAQLHWKKDMKATAPTRHPRKRKLPADQPSGQPQKRLPKPAVSESQPVPTPAQPNAGSKDNTGSNNSNNAISALETARIAEPDKSSRGSCHRTSCPDSGAAEVIVLDSAGIFGQTQEKSNAHAGNPLNKGQRSYSSADAGKSGEASGHRVAEHGVNDSSGPGNTAAIANGTKEIQASDGSQLLVETKSKCGSEDRADEQVNAADKQTKEKSGNDSSPLAPSFLSTLYSEYQQNQSKLHREEQPQSLSLSLPISIGIEPPMSCALAKHQVRRQSSSGHGGPGAVQQLTESGSNPKESEKSTTAREASLPSGGLDLRTSHRTHSTENLRGTTTDSCQPIDMSEAALVQRDPIPTEVSGRDDVSRGCSPKAEDERVNSVDSSQVDSSHRDTDSVNLTAALTDVEKKNVCPATDPEGELDENGVEQSKKLAQRFKTQFSRLWANTKQDVDEPADCVDGGQDVDGDDSGADVDCPLASAKDLKIILEKSSAVDQCAAPSFQNKIILKRVGEGHYVIGSSRKSDKKLPINAKPPEPPSSHGANDGRLTPSSSADSGFEEPVLTDDCRVICPLCPKVLTVRLLPAHMKFHFSSCHYQCGQCSFSTSYKWVLDTHASCHREEPPTDAVKLTMGQWEHLRQRCVASQEVTADVDKLVDQFRPPAKRQIARKKGSVKRQLSVKRQPSAGEPTVQTTASAAFAADKTEAVSTSDFLDRIITSRSKSLDG